MLVAKETCEAHKEQTLSTVATLPNIKYIE